MASVLKCIAWFVFACAAVPQVLGLPTASGKAGAYRASWKTKAWKWKGYGQGWAAKYLTPTTHTLSLTPTSHKERFDSPTVRLPTGKFKLLCVDNCIKCVTCGEMVDYQHIWAWPGQNSEVLNIKGVDSYGFDRKFRLRPLRTIYRKGLYGHEDEAVFNSTFNEDEAHHHVHRVQVVNDLNDTSQSPTQHTAGRFLAMHFRTGSLYAIKKTLKNSRGSTDFLPYREGDWTLCVHNEMRACVTFPVFHIAMKRRDHQAEGYPRFVALPVGEITAYSPFWRIADHLAPDSTNPRLQTLQQLQRLRVQLCSLKKTNGAQTDAYCGRIEGLIQKLTVGHLAV